MLGLGGPWVEYRNGSHGPAHVPRGVNGLRCIFLCKCSQEHGLGREYQKQIHVMGNVVRPEFFLNPCGWGSETDRSTSNFGALPKATEPFMKGLILAQNERWRRGLGMQVERAW